MSNISRDNFSNSTALSLGALFQGKRYEAIEAFAHCFPKAGCDRIAISETAPSEQQNQDHYEMAKTPMNTHLTNIFTQLDTR